jgi:hypothetical protein
MVEGIDYHGTVASFNDAGGHGADEYLAKILWGDGSDPEDGTVVETDSGYEILGDHRYNSPEGREIRVEVHRLWEDGIRAAVSTAMVLTQEEAARLVGEGADWTGYEGSNLGAEAPGVSAALIGPAPESSLFVANYNSNPLPAPVDGIAFYDVRLSGAPAGSKLVLELAYSDTAGRDVRLMYYDGTSYRALDGDMTPLSMKVDASRHVITAVFDADSLPVSGSTRGTIFTVALNPREESTISVNFSPTLALRFQESGSDALSLAATTHTLLFQTAGSLTLGLTPGEGRVLISHYQMPESPGGVASVPGRRRGEVAPGAVAAGQFELARQSANALLAVALAPPAPEQTSAGEPDLLALDALFELAGQQAMDPEEHELASAAAREEGERSMILPHLAGAAFLFGAAQAAARRHRRWAGVNHLLATHVQRPPA